MNLVYAHEKPPAGDIRSIFLAGPTPQKNSEIKSWRPEAIRLFRNLGHNGTVFIPENRNPKDEILGVKQVYWEHEMLEKADCIMFWVPRIKVKLPGLTTNVEFGWWVSSGKVVLGAPKSAYKVNYLRILGRKYRIPQSWTLPITIQNAIKLAEERRI